MWATEYVERLNAEMKTTTVKVAFGAALGDAVVQGSNKLHRAMGAELPIPFTKHTLPWGALPLAAGGALIGAAGHGHGQDDVKRNLEDAGSTPAEIARADYLAGKPKSGYGAGSALGSAAVGAGAGVGTSLALQHALGANPTLGRGVGLATGLGAAYMHARSSAQGDERDRLKGAI